MALDTICKKCFEDINEVIISRKSKDRQYKDHKKKGNQWCTKHYTEN